MSSDRYFIKKGYRPNLQPQGGPQPTPSYRWTESRIRAASDFQAHVYRLAARLVRRHQLRAIVDVGCGPAIKTRRFLFQPGRRVVGIDQPDMVRYCRERYRELEFYADDFDTPFLDLEASGLHQSFDCVVCADVIEHVRDPDVLVAYLCSLGREDAIIVISTPERDVVRGPDCMECPKADHVREWNADEFARYLRSRNISILDQRLLPQRPLTLRPIRVNRLFNRIADSPVRRSCQTIVGRLG